MPTTKDFKLEELSQYFHLPEKAVAKELGICLTSLKKLCRSYGITRWPFRKLKSIQRTLAKVQDESAQPGVSAQISAAGLMLECGESSSNGAAAAAAAEPEPTDVPANARPQEMAGSSAAAAAGGAAAASAAGGGRSAIAKKRKPFQLGGRTLMLTDEEKSIYELTIGKSGAQIGSDLKPAGGAAGSSAASSQHRTATPAEPQAATWLQSEAQSVPSPPNSSAFSCSSVSNTLQIKNWSTLWTQEHLQKRLLEPLGGNSISLTPQSNLATLHFDNEKTAQRAELICRAAAAAAEKNLKLQSHTSSRGQSPNLSQGFTPESPAGSNNSDQDGRSSALHLLMPGSKSNSDGSGGSASSVLKGKVKLEIPAAGPPATTVTSPMFKTTPTTPPTSFTSYLFEPSSQYEGGFGALLLNPSSGLQFDDPGGGCVEVPSGSMMGSGPDDMTMALVAGSTLSGSQLADSVDDAHLFIAASPPQTGEGKDGVDGKVDSNGDGASAATILLGGGPLSGAAQVLLSGQNGSAPTSPLLPPSSSPLLPPSSSPLLPPSATSPLLLPPSTATSPLLPPTSSPLLPPASSPSLPPSASTLLLPPATTVPSHPPSTSSPLHPPSTGSSLPLLAPTSSSPLLGPTDMKTPPASSSGGEALSEV